MRLSSDGYKLNLNAELNMGILVIIILEHIVAIL